MWLSNWRLLKKDSAPWSWPVSSCPTGNTLSPHYEDQSINLFREIEVYYENHMKHTSTM
jgi:hypothetical protein